MNRLPFVFLLPVLILPAYAQQTVEADAKAKIIALEQVFRLQATRVKDLKTLDELLDVHFVGVDAQGRVRNKEEMLLAVQGARFIRCAADAFDARLHGNAAVVTGVYEFESLEQGKPYRQRGRFVDTWLWRNNQWVLVASLATPNP